MNFETLIDNLTPKLRRLAVKYRGMCSYSDENDLLSEMTFYLWEKWDANDLKSQTESYIVQSCYFHLRNYMRLERDAQKPLVIDSPVNCSSDEDGAGMTLKDLIPDNSLNTSEIFEGCALYEKIMNNGLSRVEKDIIKYLFDGYTVREIGKMLDISHAMVVKHKKNIGMKVTSRYADLLV